MFRKSLLQVVCVAGFVAWTCPVASQVVPGIDVEGGWEKLDDPAADGWETEVFNESASEYLKKLGEALSKADRTSEVADILEPVEPIEMSGGFAVRRWESNEESYEGEGEVISALKQFFPGKATDPTRFKFKITSVGKLNGGSRSTEIRLETFARTASDWVEYHGELEFDWLVGEGENLQLKSMRLLTVEQVSRPLDSGPLFSDCTKSALGHNPSYEGQVLRGLPYWLERQVRRRATDVYGFPGIAVGDVNGDGLEDLFVCESEGVPHSLYLQNPDGTLTNRAKEWGVDWLDDARSALILDLDNDGDQDLAVAMIGFLLIASNEGDRFALKAALPCSEDVTHLSAADYDLDGRLDLYVSAYTPSGSEQEIFSRTNPGYLIDSDQGARNLLYRNEGEMEFADVTVSVGLDEGNLGQTLSSSWEDFDQDGDADLYVANDFGSNRFYRNDQGEGAGRNFVEIAAEVGSKDAAFGMSAAWGDFNRDGWMDLYVANMWSSAGKRIIGQEEFRPGIDERQREGFQYLARGNTLLLNDGEGGFRDVSEEAGVTMGRWAWSSPFVDFNNDGWEDLVVANGYITGTGPGDL